MDEDAVLEGDVGIAEEAVPGIAAVLVLLPTNHPGGVLDEGGFRHIPVLLRGPPRPLL